MWKLEAQKIKHLYVWHVDTLTKITMTTITFVLLANILLFLYLCAMNFHVAHILVFLVSGLP